MISQGVLGPARQIAEKNVALLAEAVRQGYTIVSTEPSAVLALTREYLHLLGDDRDARAGGRELDGGVPLPVAVAPAGQAAARLLSRST